MNQQQEEQDNTYVVDAAAFKDVITQLKKQFTYLVAINQEVVLIPKGDSLLLEDGRTLGKKEAKNLNSQFLKELDFLPRYFRKATAKKKRTSTGRRDTPTQYMGEMLEFFRNSDFGQAVIKDEEGRCIPLQGTLQDNLPLLFGEGIGGNSIMPTLMSIYHNINGTQNVDTKLFGATQEMLDTMGATFDLLYNEDVQNPRRRDANSKTDRALVGEDGKYEIPPFNPNGYQFSDVMRMISPSRVKKADRTEDVINRMEDEGVIDAIARESQIIKDTLSCIRPAEAPKSPSRRVVRRPTATPQVTARPIDERKTATSPRRQLGPQVESRPQQQVNIGAPTGALGLRRL